MIIPNTKGKSMKTSFPSPIERLVASALLSLSSSNDCPFTFYQEDDGIVAETSARPMAKMTIVKKKKKKTTERNFEQNESVSSRRFKIVSIKVVKKRRSKTEVFSKSPPESKMTSSENTASSSSSCVTAMSTCESIRRRREEEEEREYLRIRQKKMKAGSAPNMRRRAEAILGILEAGRSYSEIEIRKIFGDSPTTSKALRLLLMLEEVKRSGAGGPRDPYIYTLSKGNLKIEESTA